MRGFNDYQFSQFVKPPNILVNLGASDLECLLFANDHSLTGTESWLMEIIDPK